MRLVIYARTVALCTCISWSTDTRVPQAYDPVYTRATVGTLHAVLSAADVHADLTDHPRVTCTHTRTHTHSCRTPQNINTAPMIEI